MARRNRPRRSTAHTSRFEGLEPRQLLAAHIVGSAATYATIQAAVDAALIGQTITVDPGTYAEQVYVYKQLTLLGAQAGKDARTNLRGTNESVITGQLDVTGKITGGFKVGANDVTIDGFTVQGQTTLTDTDGAGIVILPSRNGTEIYNNIVQNNVAGLFLANNSASNPCIIRGNFFRNNNNDGIHSGRAIYTNGGFSGMNLVNVTIDNNAFLYHTGSAATTTTVEAAISLETLTAGLQNDIRITNNTFDQGGKAVLLFNTNNCLIENNTVTYMRDQWSGALRFEGGCTNIMIRNNSLYGNTGAAIRIDNKAVTGSNNNITVTGNNFYGNGYNTVKEAIIVQGDQYDGLLNATNNWWNSASGPSGSFTGTGEQVIINGNNVVVSPFATSRFARPSIGYLGVPMQTDAIIQAEEFDHLGAGIAFADSDTKREGDSKYRQPQSVDIQTTTDTGGGVNVGFVKANEWLRYTINVAQTTTYAFDARVANSAAGAKFRMEIDGVNVTGTITVPNTGGSQKWTTITVNGLNLTAGSHTMRIFFEAAGGNYNWFRLRNTNPLPTPAAPTNLAAVPSGYTGVQLSWNDNSGNESGFVIERKTGNGAWAALTTTAANVNSFLDSTTSLETSYTYRVRATASGGDSANTFEVGVTTPSLVTYLSDLPFVNETNGWGPIERDMANGSNGAGDGLPLTLNGVVYAKGLGAHATSDVSFSLNGQYTTFLADIGVDDKQTFAGSVVFQVYADNVLIYDSGVMGPLDATKSISLNVAGVTTLRLHVDDGGDDNSYDHADWANARLIAAVPPATPTGLGATAISTTQIDLSWTDTANETGYRIERSLDGVNFTLLNTVGANVTTYSDTTGSPGTLYYYQIRALNGVIQSSPSVAASATTVSVPTAPNAPSNLAASAVSNTQINLSWTDNSSNETGFILERSLNGVDGWTQIATPAANATSYSDSSGLSGSTQYFYRVRATNGVGPSSDSNVANTTTLAAPTAPAAPSGLAALGVSYQQINLTWTDNSNNETGFILERSLNGIDGWTQIATPAANATSYNDSTGLSASTQYYYRIRGTNAVGDSANSDPAGAATLAVPPAPAAPSGLSATAATNARINLTWVDNASNETGFIIERSLNGSTGWTQIATPAANATTYADQTGLAAATTYYYRVRSVGQFGQSDNSNVANAKTLSNASPYTWFNGDIGTTGAAGSYTYANGTYTVKGAGLDIWNNADQFHFVYQQITGDTTIVARVASIQNTNAVAKAGVMVRETLADNSKMAGTFVTPATGNGVRFIRRGTTAGAATSTAFTGVTAPYWVKLVRSGSTFSSYRSADGVTWTLIGSQSITMGATVYVGLAVTSKVTGTLNTSTFENVTVS